MLTGKHPANNGIVANEWHDTTTGKQVIASQRLNTPGA
jgi:predicted AlkP superfamily pyrophosphatase or phosphodiesterase